jgi:hypothetical protein
MDVLIADLQKRKSHIEGCWGRLMSCVPLATQGWRGGIDFKLIRLMFLHASELPQTFDYMSYVKRQLHVNIRHSVHIGAKTWAAMVTIGHPPRERARTSRAPHTGGAAGVYLPVHRWWRVDLPLHVGSPRG